MCSSHSQMSKTTLDASARGTRCPRDPVPANETRRKVAHHISIMPTEGYAECQRKVAHHIFIMPTEGYAGKKRRTDMFVRACLCVICVFICLRACVHARLSLCAHEPAHEKSAFVRMHAYMWFECCALVGPVTPSEAPTRGKRICAHACVQVYVEGVYVHEPRFTCMHEFPKSFERFW